MTRRLPLLLVLIACHRDDYRLAGYSPDVREEMIKLAQRNAWAGVDRDYISIPPQYWKRDDHLRGAEAARMLGDVLAERDRLVLAGDLASDTAVSTRIAEIDAGFGRVRVVGSAGRPLTIAASDATFVPGTHQEPLAHADAFLQATGSFDGMLLIGEYVLGDGLRTLTFAVTAGADPLVVDVRGHRWIVGSTPVLAPP
jgi:hypothetical protein